MNSFFHTSSEFIPGIIVFLVIVTMIITIIAYKSGSSVGKFSIITKELIENYMLCDPSKITQEINNHFQIFNTVLLSKQIHLTFLGMASISKTTIGAILFSAILPNSGKLISHFYPSTSES
jgi:hypothetical protein